MKIAILGTGKMGTGMAEGYLKAGHEVIVYNRTASKAEALVQMGASISLTPADAIAKSDAAILVFSDANVVKEALLNETTVAVLKGKKIMNAATTNPFEIEEIAAQVKHLGGDLAEMSILVGDEQLRQRQGNFLIGCSDEVRAFWIETMQIIGTSHHVGRVGDASKAEVPMLFGSMFMSMTLAYSAALAMKLNVPQEIVASQLGMFVPGVEHMLPNVYARDYSQCMASVDSFKDVTKTGIATAKSIGVPTKVLEDILEIYEKAAQLGYGSQDGTAIIEVLLGQETK